MTEQNHDREPPEERVVDDFYSGTYYRKKRPRSSNGRSSRKRERRTDSFDESGEKVRRPRSNNRGMARLMRRFKRSPDFRMRMLWILAGLLIAAILAVALIEDLKYRRIEKQRQREELAEERARAAKEKPEDEDVRASDKFLFDQLREIEGGAGEE
ncbi:hypothetical protein [Kiritimatiella glycovorans]|uniref:Uncharacterized protein n=1 Tax=Kiritimatiella glycovorans TaxID=1307763 RepID=A0A0G3EG01_9BACT|nr:hypothetical protein [Kiritimatiella glycovorans]AKJ63755.1 hypothetical protein L21SP4_00475 [Kiritimatiella glycovorans]